MIAVRGGRRRPGRWIVAGLGVVVLTIVLGTGLGGGDESASTTVSTVREMDEPAPALRGRTLDGGSFDLSELRGTVVVVNVWASWCSPCRQELPVLASAAREWAGKVRFVGLAVRDDEDDARALLREVGATAVTTVPDPDGTLAVDWGVRGVPETFVLDRSGRIRFHVVGVVSGEWLEQNALRLAAGP